MRIHELKTKSALVRSRIEGVDFVINPYLVRKILEPNAPAIMARVRSLQKLHEAGITTWAFISPMLPMNPDRLYEIVDPHVDYVLFDALNYQPQVRALFKSHGWEHALGPEYAEETEAALRELFGDRADGG